MQCKNYDYYFIFFVPEFPLILWSFFRMKKIVVFVISSNRTTIRNKQQGSHSIYIIKQLAALFLIPYCRPI